MLNRFPLAMRAPCCIALLALLCALTVLSTMVCNYSAAELIQRVKPSFEYAVVCDAGSSGTRMHVFHVPDRGRISEVGQRNVEPGLASFAQEPFRSTKAAEYLRPLFDYAAQAVPHDAHSRTAVFIRGTGGLRALPRARSRALYRQLLHQFRRGVGGGRFRLRAEHLGSITGEQEAYYAALAANYLSRRLSEGLLQQPGVEALGALDMGGQSLQLVYDPRGPPAGPAARTMRRGEMAARSFDGFGAERMREAIDGRVLKLHHMELQHGGGEEEGGGGSGSSSSSGGGGGNATEPRQLRHPCFNPGVQFAPSKEALALAGPGAANAAAAGSWRFAGSGNADACRLLLDDQLASRRAAGGGAARGCADGAHACTLDGSAAPPLRGSFLAMSGFYFAADCLRALAGHRRLVAAWPRPSPAELVAATADFCAMPLETLSVPPLSTAHRLTPPKRMPIRCFQSSYVNALLGAEGLALGPNSRNVTFGSHVEGVTVQWPLGALLHEMSANAHALVEEEVDIVVCKVRRSAFGMMLVLLLLISACAFQLLMNMALKGHGLFSLRMDAGMLGLVLCGFRRSGKKKRGGGGE